MTETRTLTDREEIRDWAAARMGSPAFIDQSSIPGGSPDPILTILFDQHAYQDRDEGPDPLPSAGGVELSDWDEWLSRFEQEELALVVAKEEPGRKDSFFEIVRRGSDQTATQPISGEQSDG